MGIYNRGRKFNTPGTRRKPSWRFKPKRTIAKKAVRSALNKNFNKRVKNVIANQLEVKQKTYVLTKSSVPGGAYYQYIRGGGLIPGVTADNGLCIRNILSKNVLAQGVESSQRIGLAVNVKSLTIQGIIHSQAFDSTVNHNPNPFEVIMVIYKAKNDPTGDPNKIKLDEETNSAVAITSSPYNDMYTWNRADYVIKKVRRFRFQPMPFVQQTTETATTGSVAMNPISGSAMNKMAQRFNISIPIKKELTYNRANNVPQNEWVSVGFYVVNLDGTLPPSSQIRATVYMTSKLKYTDP